jgi:hypothetical protein
MTEERQPHPAEPIARDEKPVPQPPKNEDAVASEAAKLADKVKANA